MLIIAIPKSASTSLLKTLGKIHKLETTQSNEFKENPVPESTEILHKYHTDVREVSQENVLDFQSKSIIYKQHIYPSKNNLAQLASTKKIILLRNTKDVILAYKRGIEKKVHNKVEGFSENMEEDEWLECAKGIGLSSDLNSFYTIWKNIDDELTLVVHYEELIKNTSKEINRIENFLGLKRTKKKIKLSKKRYTRQNSFKIAISNLILKFKRFVVNTLSK